MKYTINIDEDKYILSIANTEQDDIELDLDEMELDYLNAYQLIDGKAILDEQRKAEIIAEEQQQEKEQEIAELKQYMSDTDYIWNVIKEGDATEEEYADVIQRRHEVRLRIRELEL